MVRVTEFIVRDQCWYSMTEGLCAGRHIPLFFSTLLHSVYIPAAATDQSLSSAARGTLISSPVTGSLISPEILYHLSSAVLKPLTQKQNPRTAVIRSAVTLVGVVIMPVI